MPIKEPPSPCSYGCLPCNLYCFIEVMKRTEILRRQFAREQAIKKALKRFGLSPHPEGEQVKRCPVRSFLHVKKGR